MIDQTPRLLVISACNMVWLLFESGVYLRVVSISFSACMGVVTIYSAIPALSSPVREKMILTLSRRSKKIKSSWRRYMYMYIDDC